MIPAQINIPGLSDSEVSKSRIESGNNDITIKTDRVFPRIVKEIVSEPMFVLLLAACIVYFIAGEFIDGCIMLSAIFIVSGISFYQSYRSEKAINALKKLSAAKAKVLRNGIVQQIPTEQIVVNDILLLEEGEIIAADGTILSSNDLSVNESVLTGESFPVQKISEETLYKGTLVIAGTAIIKITAVGDKTMFGKIGLSLRDVTIQTPLQNQIRSFVRIMVWAGAAAFMIVVAYNYYLSGEFTRSLLQGLTLAMSILPEEIPVAFVTFQALGAFRLLSNSIIVKSPQYVETLGSATVICVDKTGTLTQNKMSIAYLYDAASNDSINCKTASIIPLELIEYAMWSSETNPYEEMEKTIHSLYERSASADRRNEFIQVHEYPLEGKPPMMTHIFKNKAGEEIIAAKGGPEAILQLSNLTASEKNQVEKQSLTYAKQGYRVLGIGKGIWNDEQYPLSQQEFRFKFLGLIAFQDPPKPNITETIKTFYNAGIGVKIITGDYPETAISIANQIRLKNNGAVLSGKEVQHLTIKELQNRVKTVDIYARMFPEAKLKVIDALKENGEVVAMTGDGVNDAPALKAAHIGIAMGMRGSEVAKNAASLIITDDDLKHMAEAVALGRKIYDNLKKAIRYIISIHIPIILIVIVPLLFGWRFGEIFSPVHVIFLELIMGPTCSIIYENEQMEPNTMSRPPRVFTSTFLSGSQLGVSIIQGIMITAGCLGIGFYFMQQGSSETLVRSVIFVTLLFSNIFLTLINRSFNYSIFKTIQFKNYLIPLVTVITFIFVLSVLYIPFIRQLFDLESIPVSYLLLCIAVSMLSTFWIELTKVKARNFRISAI